MSPFENLLVWKKSSRLCVELYKALYSLKDFGFRDQITRAAVSIPSNIAEGFERGTDKEKAHFLNYSKGSTGEVRTQIYLGMEIGYIDRKQGALWISESKEIGKMLHALIIKLRD